MKTNYSLNIDYILSKDLNFWQNLEAERNSKYPDIKFFNFSKEKINDLKQYYDYEDTLQNIEEAIISINILGVEYVNSTILNQSEKKEMFVSKLEKIKENFKS